MAFKMKGSTFYGSPLKKYASDKQRKAIWASKNEKSPVTAKDCNCWEGYKRVPGTKPCAKGSCTKA
jgi:hypothetical protein|tara:strand:- start:266 stop:463 length:198 start_codon:yes stop_codon:yes gene_type:complete